MTITTCPFQLRVREPDSRIHNHHYSLYPDRSPGCHHTFSQPTSPTLCGVLRPNVSPRSSSVPSGQKSGLLPCAAVVVVTHLTWTGTQDPTVCPSDRGSEEFPCTTTHRPEDNLFSPNDSHRRYDQSVGNPRSLSYETEVNRVQVGGTT